MSKKEVKKNTLDVRTRAIATSGKAVGMPNRFNLPQNKEKRLLHIEICKKLVEYADKYNYTVSKLVYFAIGKNAHRINVFFEGYATFNEKKVTTIFKWLNMFAKYNDNHKLFHNADVMHALVRFYDKYSTKTSDFKAALANYTPNPKVTDFTMVANGLGIAKKSVETEMAEAEVEAVMVGV